MAKILDKIFGTETKTETKELPQIEVIINNEKTNVPPYVAINLEANKNNK